VGGAGAVAETVEDKGHLGNDPLAADFVKGEAVVAAVVVVWVVAVPFETKSARSHTCNVVM
jgi:hypothetical protein